MNYEIQGELLKLTVPPPKESWEWSREEEKNGKRHEIFVIEEKVIGFPIEKIVICSISIQTLDISFHTRKLIFCRLTTISYSSAPYSYLQMFNSHWSDCVVGHDFFLLKKDFDESIGGRGVQLFGPVHVTFSLEQTKQNESQFRHPTCNAESRTTYPSPFHEIGDHDDDVDILLPDHPPERLTSLLQGPLGADVSVVLLKAVDKIGIDVVGARDPGILGKTDAGVVEGEDVYVAVLFPVDLEFTVRTRKVGLAF